MPSIKSLLPLVLVASTALAIPQGINPAETAQKAVKKTLNGRGEAPRRELIQVYPRDTTNEKGSGGIGGAGGTAETGGDGTKYGKGGNGARGGFGGRGGSGEYFSGKLIEDKAERTGRQGGEEKAKDFSDEGRVFYRRADIDRNGAGGGGGNGGFGSNGGNAKDFGRGGRGAEGGVGGNGGRGKYFNGIKDESGKGYKNGDKNEDEKEY